MPFDPAPNDRFELRLSSSTHSFHIAPHPAAPNYVHAMEGGKATVYRLLSDSESDSSGMPQQYALKVMRPVYSIPELAAITQNLDRLKTLPGLRVCERRCLTPNNAASTLQQFPELTYSTIMPWIKGKPWFECLIHSKEGTFSLTKQKSLTAAKSLCAVVAQLELGGFAHCDLSAGNLVLDPNTFSVDLIDVEDMYASGFQAPSALPAGTPGYQHRTSGAGQWSAEADRFSAAILMSEMLALHDPDAVNASHLESFFDPCELQTSNSQRYHVMKKALTLHSAHVANLFDRAWNSDTLLACPRIQEWKHALNSTHLKFEAFAPPEPPAEFKPFWDKFEFKEQQPLLQFSEPFQAAPVTQPVIRWEK